MLSQIHFKLRSQRPYSTVTFDGSFIALSELKKKMADRLNLLKTKASTDFELKIHDAQSNEEYVGDETHVMKNSSVLVSRLPAVNGLPKWLHDARQEKMRAEDKAAEPTIDAAASTQVLAGVAEVLGGTEAEMSEEQGLNNLMDATAKIYEKKVAANPIARYSGGGKGGQGTGIVHVVRERQPGAPEKEKAIPPPGYVCHRCKQPGHYKYDCPTADDEKFDHTRCKAIAGVPSARVRAMTTEESEKVVGRLMNGNGEFVEVLDDSDTFDKMMGSSRKTVPAVVKMPARFECPMCHKLLKDAVLTRCCQTNFCDDCIRPALMEDPACPACKKDCPPDKLIAATKLRDEIASGEWKKQMLPPAPVVAAPVKEVIPPPPPPPVIIPPPPPPPDDVPPPPPPPQVSEVPREDLENEEEVPLTREEFEALQNEHRAKIQKEKETKLRREERAEYSRNRDEGNSRRDRDEGNRDEGSRRNRDEGSSRRDRDEGNRDEGSRRNRDEGHGRGRDEGNRRDRDEGNRRGKDEGNRRGKDEGNMRERDEGNRRDRSSGRDDEHQLEKQESQQHNSPKRHSRGLSDNKDGVVKTSSGLILTDARQRIARARESKKAETKHDHQEERRERRDRDKDDKRSKRRDREDKQDRREHSSKKHKKDKEHKRSFQESKPVQDRSKRSRSGSANDGRKKSRPNKKDDDTGDAKEEAWGQDRWDPHDDEDMNLTI